MKRYKRLGLEDRVQIQVLTKKAKEKPNSATVAENQKLQRQEKRRDELAANEKALKERQQGIEGGPKDNGAKDKESQLQSAARDQGKQESQLTSQIDSNSAQVKADQQSQISPSSPPSNQQTTLQAKQHTIAETENKSVQTYNSANQGKRAATENRLSNLTPPESTDSSDLMHSMFAASQNKSGTHQASSSDSPTATTRTTSFASSQSDLTTDAEKRLQKLGAEMQTAFASRAQGTNTPSTGNTPIVANNNPSSTQSGSNKLAIPAPV